MCIFLFLPPMKKDFDKIFAEVWVTQGQRLDFGDDPDPGIF